ncbi:uncharacterized protein MELLADRAFT_84337 [Melampsora larici-populina 98AG31]|uniref:Uncharacterized protein n=1 Tax=Melampsora larici-populina (strain 98AG31 / pathotype 3-4-7) TaxID=747676 RepID=F4RFD8_MELLP|nr:uncharacterized protein MELLADRAFT_84337 [Melampsora larici-populina 98AG31]EGG08952.1 hypothetical protein MELLADRAFT_84337 [Melampsora larici-populina 98AG31]
MLRWCNTAVQDWNKFPNLTRPGLDLDQEAGLAKLDVNHTKCNYDSKEGERVLLTAGSYPED